MSVGIVLIGDWLGGTSPLWAAAFPGEVTLAYVRKLAKCEPLSETANIILTVSASSSCLSFLSDGEWPESANQIHSFLSQIAFGPNIRYNNRMELKHFFSLGMALFCGDLLLGSS